MKILVAGPGTGKTTKILEIISEQYPDGEKIQVISFTNATVKDLVKSFKDNKNVRCSTLHSFALGLNHLQKDIHIIDNKFEEKILLSLSAKVNIEFPTLLDMLKCIIYNGMIASCVAFIKANPAYAEEIIGKLNLLIVDEFQDFNPDEQNLVMLISELSEETMILGDDDQSIYEFKDAAPDGIIALFNNPKIDKIDHENKCHRCPDRVVDFSLALIKNNKRRIDKEWKKTGKAGEVYFSQFTNQDDTDKHILTTLKSIKEKDPNASVLILSRIGVAVDTIKTLLTENQIEFIDCWDDKWRIEVLSKIWWLKAIYGKNKLPFIIFLLKYNNNFGKPKLIKLLTSKFQSGFKEQDLVKELIELKYLPEELSSFVLSPPAINDFFSSQQEFDFLKEYFDEQSIDESINQLSQNAKTKKEFEKNKINLMSIHKSKGLQAEYVIISGLVSGIIPNETIGVDTIEAQRRLLFVGMTRAIKELHMVSTVEWQGRDLMSNRADMSQFLFNRYTRKHRGKTSKFIEEIQNQKN